MSNNFFSFSRFGILFRKHLKENGRKYLLFALMLFGIEFILQGFVTLMRGSGGFNIVPYKAIFILSILFSSTIFASLSYSFFSNKAKGIQYLQLPASDPEKILVSFIVSQVFFFIVFLACYYAANWIICSLYNSLSDFTAKGATPETLKYYKAHLYDCTDDDGKFGIVMAFVLSAAAHFGSLLFEKSAFVRTSLIVMLLMGFIIWLNYSMPKALIQGADVMPRGFLYNISLRIEVMKSTKGNVALPAGWKSFLPYFVPISLYICFWTASFFKLKEKQV